jgi:hypothetical protein
MSTKPAASICDAGRKCFLRDQSITNEEIALHLTGVYHVVAGNDMGGEGQPPGTFWVDNRLVAVRTEEDEVVVLSPFNSRFTQAMLAIADFDTGG